jgi:hypothetical protein
VRRAFVLAVSVALAACKTSPTTPDNHRPSDIACPLGAPISANECDAASDCPAVPQVACLVYDDAGISFCNADPCHVDSDCSDGGVCLCGSAATSSTIATSNMCLPAGNCTIDSDCSPVHYCSPSSIGCGTTFSYYCHTANDDCANDTDCRDTQFCQYAPGAGGSGKWTCVDASTCSG